MKLFSFKVLRKKPEEEEPKPEKEPKPEVKPVPTPVEKIKKPEGTSLRSNLSGRKVLWKRKTITILKNIL